MDIPSILYDILLLSLGGFVLHGPDGSLFSVFSANDCLFVLYMSCINNCCRKYTNVCSSWFGEIFYIINEDILHIYHSTITLSPIPTLHF